MRTIKQYFKKRHQAKRYAKWLLNLIKPWLPIIIIVSLVNAAVSVMGVGIAAINKQVVDQATAGKPVFNEQIFAILAAVTLCNIFFSIGINVVKTLLNERYGYSLKEQFYEKILQAQWLPLSKIHSGDLMTRITSDVDTVASGMFSVVPSAFFIVFQLVTAFLVLYHYDPLLSLFALCLGPIGVIMSVLISRIFAKYQRESRENEAAYRAFMQESVENLVIIKSFSKETYSKFCMQEFWKKRYEIIKKRSIASLGMGLGMSVIFSGGYLIAFGWSLIRLVRGEITYGTVTLLLTLVGQVQSPMQGLQTLMQQLVAILVSAGRIMEISEMPEEQHRKAKALHVPALHPNEALGVCAKHLEFTYSEREKPVLQELEFDFQPGETVGIIGQSGAGKTTIIRLLLALIMPQQGTLRLYQSDGKEYMVNADMRDYISYVPQGNTLISGSIRQNLWVGKENASENEMWQALELVEAAEFVRNLPGGLDAQILEKGGAISEGQAQRIAIARAVIKPAAILILDEATASLDMKTEEKIVRNLQTAFANLTCIVVTHRPSLLSICERTYELEHGKLREVSV